MAKRILVLCTAAACFFCGCSKKEKVEADTAQANEPAVVTPKTAGKAKKNPTEAPPPDALPGASDVRNALAKQDYTGAVERLQLLKGLANNDQLWAAYRELSGEVGLTLTEAAKTNPNAQQALGTYRLMMYGR